MDAAAAVAGVEVVVAVGVGVGVGVGGAEAAGSCAALGTDGDAPAATGLTEVTAVGVVGPAADEVGLSAGSAAGSFQAPPGTGGWGCGCPEILGAPPLLNEALVRCSNELTFPWDATEDWAESVMSSS